MQCAVALSCQTQVREAVKELSASIRRQLVRSVDLLLVFFTPEYHAAIEKLSFALRHSLKPRVLLGCTGEGIIAGDRELEGTPSIAVLAASLPGVALFPFAIPIADWESLLSDAHGSRIRQRVGSVSPDPDETRAFVLLADPFSTPAVEWLQALDHAFPGIPAVGGMASGGVHPGDNRLIVQEEIIEDGAIGVRVAGPVRVDTVVSQGCRPIGDPLLVTGAEGNLILTLGGRPGLDVVREQIERLRPEEQMLVLDGLFLGIVINEYQHAFERGDFLVRHVLGVDQNTGAIAIGDNVRAGQTVQLHVRDAVMADRDLRAQMALAARDETAPLGGLIFSCNGRGSRLFDVPHHDIGCVLEAVPETPIAGFFAAGELGPAGGRNFVHGNTACVALFRPI
ncbi:MAG: FIST N-terminal domain-containing protein [Chloroherpetonaceae bacterium]|nr:FIST C-terminal domain-containing protein [Chthonomonadaceae bacterium]MDW8208248.1 FIST N-terminal domain-containing protein [Chloroherpetonaceae bacterium]